MTLEKDSLIETFLSMEENLLVFNNYVNDPSERNKEALDKQFRKYFYIVRCVSYFVKMIHFESKHFDKKQRRRDETYRLTLDKENDDGDRIVDLVTDLKASGYTTKDLEEMSEDPVLHALINNLTEKQKKILYYIYVEDMRDVEVARVLGITQQAATKARRMALAKIRKGLLRDARRIS